MQNWAYIENCLYLNLRFILFFLFVFMTGKDITDEVLKNAVAPKKCITIQPQIVFEYDVNYTTPVRNKA